MAFTEKLPSGRYRGVFYDRSRKPNRQRVPGTFTEKRAALHAAQECEIKARRRAPRSGQYDPRMTWSDWCEIWWRNRNIEKSTGRTETWIRDNHLLPTFGDVPMNELNTWMIQTWITGIAKQTSAAHAVRCYTPFHASLKQARIAGVIADDPCLGVVKPTVSKSRRRHVEVSEFDGLMEVLRPNFIRHLEVFQFILETGLRPNELCGLHRHNVHARSITVADTIPTGAREVKDDPKDGDIRSVPLTARATKLLEKWSAEDGEHPSCGLPHETGLSCPSDLAARQANGRPFSVDTLQQRFKRAAREAGLHGLTVYSLRHAYGTRLAENGVDAFTIARLMGHASVDQTMDYVHETSTQHDRVLIALGNLHAV